MNQKLMILSTIYSFYLYGMENDNNSLIPKDLSPEIVKTACYFILHRHFKNKVCLRHAEPSCIEIKSQLCPAHHNPVLQDYFKEAQKILIFYNQDKQPLLEDVKRFSKAEKTASLLKRATRMLDPEFKPRVTHGIKVIGSMPPTLHFFDKDNELILRFWGYDDDIKLPFTQEQKEDLSRFVELTEDFTLTTPEPKGCCLVV